MTTALRKRRTEQERIDAKKAEIADLEVKRRSALKKHMDVVAKGLDVIAETTVDVGPIAAECKGLAVRLRSWA